MFPTTGFDAGADDAIIAGPVFRGSAGDANARIQQRELTAKTELQQRYSDLVRTNYSDEDSARRLARALDESSLVVTVETRGRGPAEDELAVTETLRNAGVNAYPPPDAPVHQPRYTGALFPTLDNVYDGFYLSLQPGQALRLHGKPPTARFWSFVFYDRWFNTPDFARHRCYLTGSDVVLDADGSYEVILGPDDPGHPNWIETAGLTEGMFAIRCLLPEQRELPTSSVIGVACPT